MNQAKAAAGSKGRLKPNGFRCFDELYNTGIGYDEMKTVAEELAKIGKDVDWYSFREILRDKKAKGGI